MMHTELVKHVVVADLATVVITFATSDHVVADWDRPLTHITFITVAGGFET